MLAVVLAPVCVCVLVGEPVSFLERGLLISLLEDGEGEVAEGVKRSSSNQKVPELPLMDYD